MEKIPTVCMFYGIIIRMYVSDNEHKFPHFHAYYGEYKISVSISNGAILKGKMPKRQVKYIVAWAEIHREELLANFALAVDGETIFGIDPLK